MPSNRAFFKPPVPAVNFSSKTVIITGANVSPGKEAVKHFARLRAAKVIATARAAALAELAEIEAETGRTGVVEFWDLDYSAYASLRAGCEARVPRRRGAECGRQDIQV
ncbi:hypothetical protein V2W45_1348790 [Cenococcum geophilum]